MEIGNGDRASEWTEWRVKASYEWMNDREKQNTHTKSFYHLVEHMQTDP